MFLIIKRTIDGRTVQCKEGSQDDLRKHLLAMWKHTDLVLVAVINID
jgi:hypothetical protein